MNIDELLKEVESLRETIAQKEIEIQSLKEENQKYIKIIFGRRSERRNFDATAKEQSSLFDEAEKTVDEEAKSPGLFTEEEKQKRGGRNPIPVDIPRDEEKLIPGEGKLICRYCNTKLAKIGESITEKLEIIPEKVIVRKIVRPKYKCPCCETEPTEIIIEPLPKMLLPKATPGAGFMAYAITNKFADRIPYYHFSKILARAGVDISRWDLSRWSMDVFEKHVEMPLEKLRKALFQTDYLQIDETTLQVLSNPGTRYMWAVHGNLAGKKIAYFHYSPSRSAEFLKEWLKDFSGVVQTDGFKSYDTHLKGLAGVIHAGCNVHARRMFTECADSPEVRLVLEEYSKIYQIESDLEKAKAPPDKILSERKNKSLSILEGLRERVNEWALKFRPAGNFGRAIKYFLNEYAKLIVFTEHPHVRPDTNLVENDIRPFAIGRKNWLFSGSESGAKASAGLYTLVQIANLNGWDPYLFLYTLFLAIEDTENEIDLVQFITSYSPVRP